MPVIARWPERVAGGAVCSQLTSHSDLLATCAEIIGADVPEGAGEDSVSALPLLEGSELPARAFAVHHSCNGKFAIRKGDWVFIDAPSGDDNKEPDWFKRERGYVAHDFPGELYDLERDIAERRNLYSEHPEVVAELRALLEKAKGGLNPGLSTPADEVLTE